LGKMETRKSWLDVFDIDAYVEIARYCIKCQAVRMREVEMERPPFLREADSRLSKGRAREHNPCRLHVQMFHQAGHRPNVQMMGRFIEQQELRLP
jgi:hypothetical protein